MKESNLGPPPILEPELECFLGVPMPMWGAGDRWDSPPEPSINNYEIWLEWQAHRVNTPDWWKELVAIPNAGDPKRLAQKICTSFEVPRVRCETIRDNKNYTVPPAPKCIKWGMFLPNDMPYQDI